MIQKSYFLTDNGRVNSQRVKRTWLEKNNPDFLKKIEKNVPLELRIVEKIWLYFENLSEPPKCKHCNLKNVKFLGLLNGYREYCSTKCSNSADDVKLKKEQIYLMKYNVKNPFQSESIKDKIKKTLIKKYNVDNIAKSIDHKQKTIETNVKRYNANWGLSKNSTVRDNLNIQNKLNFEKLLKDNNFTLLNWSPDKFGMVKIHSNACNHTFELNKWQTYQRLMISDVELCPICNPFGTCKNTNIELNIQNLLKENNIEFITNYRKLINPLEVDIFVPSKNLAIEINGIYWHSDIFKGKDYHTNKHKMCKEKNIQLLTIWEDQLLYKKSIVESIILSKLGIFKNRIFARSCEIKEISTKEATHFLKNTHLQGYSTSTVKIGLFHNNELISVATFGKQRIMYKQTKTNDFTWELVRFATKLNTQIVGGFSKLMAYFVRKYKPFKIISFASKDISNGKSYEKLGFNKINETSQSYWYVDKATLTRHNRYTFRKSQLIKMGYSKKMTEFEIMNELSYFRIWDTGQIKYLLTVN